MATTDKYDRQLRLWGANGQVFAFYGLYFRNVLWNQISYV